MSDPYEGAFRLCEEGEERRALAQVRRRDITRKLAGDLIALGKFLRDHQVGKTLEAELRGGAKRAAEAVLQGLARDLVAALPGPVSVPADLPRLEDLQARFPAEEDRGRLAGRETGRDINP